MRWYFLFGLVLSIFGCSEQGPEVIQSSAPEFQIRLPITHVSEVIETLQLKMESDGEILLDSTFPWIEGIEVERPLNFGANVALKGELLSAETPLYRGDTLFVMPEFEEFTVDLVLLPLLKSGATLSRAPKFQVRLGEIYEEVFPLVLDEKDTFTLRLLRSPMGMQLSGLDLKWEPEAVGRFDVEIEFTVNSIKDTLLWTLIVSEPLESSSTQESSANPSSSSEPLAPPGMRRIAAKNIPFAVDYEMSFPTAYGNTKLTYDFWIDTTEVTQGQFEALMTKYYPNYVSIPRLTEIGAGGNYPAYGVSWNDAVLFCNAKSKEAGLDTVYVYQSIEWTGGAPDIVVHIRDGVNGFRLPTDAEFEFATKAGADTIAYWVAENSTKVEDYANFGGVDGTQKVLPVASLKPNAFGLYDMQGNVSEWMNDFAQWASTLMVEENPIGPSIGGMFLSETSTGAFESLEGMTNHLARGGSWVNSPQKETTFSDVRTLEALPEGNRLGFRTVLPIDQGKIFNYAPSLLKHFPGYFIDDVSYFLVNEKRSLNLRVFDFNADDGVTVSAEFNGDFYVENGEVLLWPKQETLGTEFIFVKAIDQSGLESFETYHQVNVHGKGWVPEQMVPIYAKDQVVLLDSLDLRYFRFQNDYYMDAYERDVFGEWQQSAFFAFEFANELSRHYALDEMYDLSNPALPPQRKNTVDFSGFLVPSEAEWIYAALGGSMTGVPTNCTVLIECAWVLENSNGITQYSGALMANGWGLYDVLGNRAELVDQNQGPYIGSVGDTLTVHQRNENNSMYLYKGGTVFDNSFSVGVLDKSLEASLSDLPSFPATVRYLINSSGN